MDAVVVAPAAGATRDGGILDAVVAAPVAPAVSGSGDASGDASGDVGGILGEVARFDAPARTFRELRDAPTGPSTAGGTEEPRSVVVGGVEYTVGGWAEFEFNTRRARGALGERPGARYPGRSFVYPDDAVEALTRRPPTAAHRAAGELAAALGRFERRAATAVRRGRAVAIPRATAADARAVAKSGAFGAAELAHAGELAASVAEDLRGAGARGGAAGPDAAPLAPLSLPFAAALPLGGAPVAASDDAAVVALETSACVHAVALERALADVAARLAEAAAVADAALRRAPRANDV